MIECVVFPLDRHLFIPSLGVAHRVSGIGLAGEAIDRVVDILLPRISLTTDALLSARIDPDNIHAKSVFTGRGFVQTGLNGRFEVWARRID